MYFPTFAPNFTSHYTFPNRSLEIVRRPMNHFPALIMTWRVMIPTSSFSYTPQPSSPPLWNILLLDHLSSEHPSKRNGISRLFIMTPHYGDWGRQKIIIRNQNCSPCRHLTYRYCAQIRACSKMRTNCHPCQPLVTIMDNPIMFP